MFRLLKNPFLLKDILEKGAFGSFQVLGIYFQLFLKIEFLCASVLYTAEKIFHASF